MRTGSSILTAGCISCLFGGGQADAQVDPGEFELVEIGAFDLSGNGDGLDEDSEAFGLNAGGEVVGSVVATPDSGGSQEHAFLWLPESRYGLPGGLLDLHLLAGLPSTTDSRAHEISDHGIIVGVHDGLAWLWHLQGDGTVESFAIPRAQTPCPPIELLVGGPLEGEAWSVNNWDYPEFPLRPVIVGWYDDPDDLCGTPPLAAPVRRGFRVSYDPLEKTFCDFIVLVPADNPMENRSQAFDVNDTEFGLGITNIAGREEPCDFGDIQCDPDNEGTGWLGGGAPMHLPDYDEREEWGRGVNDAGNVAGWGLRTEVEGDDQNCFQAGLFWLFAQMDPTDLSLALPSEGESYAEAINDLNEIVGVALQFNRAALWLPNPDPEAYPFAGFDLNTVPLVWCESCVGGSQAHNREMVLVRANDINNSRQIVGAGSRDDILNGKLRAYILTPRDPDCPADVNNDGEVDVDDYTEVILLWNTDGCGTPTGCTDVDRDGDTDVDDLTAGAARVGSVRSLTAAGRAGGSGLRGTDRAARPGVSAPLTDPGSDPRGRRGDV